MSEGKERKVIKYGDESKETVLLDSSSSEETAAGPEVHGYFVERERTESVGPEPVRLSQEELDARTEARRSHTRAKRIRKKRLTIFIMVVAFALLATMCGKDIVRLKAENVALKRQQAALKKERDELKAELENTSEQEYIRDQARKQLRLLNPGELLFVWDE